MDINKKTGCDCLSTCGDDPGILQGTVRPCLQFAKCYLNQMEMEKLIDPEFLIPLLQEDAINKLKAAEKAWHRLFVALPVGDARIKAAEVFENVRTANRVGAQ